MHHNTEFIALVGLGTVYDVLLFAGLRFAGVLPGPGAVTLSMTIAFVVPFFVLCCSPSFFIDHFTPYFMRLVLICATILFACAVYIHLRQLLGM